MRFTGSPQANVRVNIEVKVSVNVNEPENRDFSDRLRGGCAPSQRTLPRHEPFVTVSNP